MTTQAQTKYKALSFWDKHGIKATQDAYKVSGSTLYRWRKLYCEQGLAGLSDRSKIPIHKRTRNWSLLITKHIRHLRHSYPNIGSEKLYRLLKPWCNERDLVCPKPRTIARLIADSKDKMRCVPEKCGRRRKARPYQQRNRLGKGFSAGFPGHCVAMDTIVYFVNRTRYYLLTAIDHYSRFAMAVTSRRANSQTAADFVQLVERVFPGQIEQVLTDNGSEYQGEFNAYCEQRGIKHCYTYPRCPKMNAYNERFNRTLQEEFVEHHEGLLEEDLSLFNDVLFEYLGRYNFRRPHYGLGYDTPVQKLVASIPGSSNMSWHHTVPDALCLWGSWIRNRPTKQTLS